MGLADVVPGVSGGTMALLLGIYPRFIAALASIGPELGRPLLLVHRASSRRELARAAVAADLPFLIWLGLGILAALLVGANAIGWLIDHQPQAMMALFFGLILASARIPWNRIPTKSPRAYGLFAAGATVAALFASLPQTHVHPHLGLIAVAGVLAISVMLLPGISGSAVLLALGMYTVVLDAVRGLDLATLSVFASGALVGLLVASRVISAALRRFPGGTLALMTGLMIGSTIRVWPWRSMPEFGSGSPTMPSTLVPVLYMLAGALLTVLLDRIAAKDGGAITTRRRQG